MAIYNNYSLKDRQIKSGYFDNPALSGSNITHRLMDIDYEEWVKFISYYRYHIDEFAEDVLGIMLFDFQKLQLRAMARNQNSMLICCRGIGKSWISAVFMVCTCILYPGFKFGIVSGKGIQSRNVIIQKIDGELAKNENLKREIQFPIHTGQENTAVYFKNGSYIRAIVLGHNQSGDSARSWRFNAILVDEARLVPDETVETVLVPMTKTNRENLIKLKRKFPSDKLVEKGKMIYISSAHLKTTDLYKRFLDHYKKMSEGNKDYFVCSLDYRVGVHAGIFEEEDILQERLKPSMSEDRFTFEYLGIFVGSSLNSYYPFELTEKCRILDSCELQQSKRCQAQYVITHDVAVSSGHKSDNAVTHVIKIKQRSGGTFYKEVVYTKTMNGASLLQQRDFLRELIHIKFPNTVKVVIDVLGSGAGLPALFYESWEYKNPETNVKVEFPPIIKDDDEEGFELEGAIPMIRPIAASGQFNAKYYPYMKSCFEDRSCRLLQNSTEKDVLYKEGEITPEEYGQFVETDILIQELSNIQKTFTDSGLVIYEKIVKSKKRDRATSLMYGLSYIYELEAENRANYYKKKDDGFAGLTKYINF